MACFCDREEASLVNERVSLNIKIEEGGGGQGGGGTKDRRKSARMARTDPGRRRRQRPSAAKRAFPSSRDQISCACCPSTASVPASERIANLKRRKGKKKKKNTRARSCAVIKAADA